MERHQRALVGKNERTGLQSRKQSMSLCAVHNFLPNSSSTLGAVVKKIHESSFKHSETDLQNAVAVGVSVKNSRSLRDTSALLQVRACSCMKLHMLWPRHKTNTAPSHANAVPLFYTYTFHRHLLSFKYPGAVRP